MCQPLVQMIKATASGLALGFVLFWFCLVPRSAELRDSFLTLSSGLIPGGAGGPYGMLRSEPSFGGVRGKCSLPWTSAC